MADNKRDVKKLRQFVEAALTNPRHPVYRLGLSQSPILQHYAVNVATLKVIEAEQWFEEYPDYTARLEQVMRLCEAEGAPEPDGELAALRTENEQLKARLADLQAAAETPEAEAEA